MQSTFHQSGKSRVTKIHKTSVTLSPQSTLSGRDRWKIVVETRWERSSEDTFNTISLRAPQKDRLQQTPYWTELYSYSNFWRFLRLFGVSGSRWEENGVRLDGPRISLPIPCLHLSSVLSLGSPRVSPILCDEWSGSCLTSYRQ